jgi:predicted amidohydrolase YtcJ
MFDLGGRTVVPGLIDNHSHRLCNAFWNDGPEGLVRAAKEAAEEGYTTVHELYGDPGFVDAVAALVPENRLAVRINCYVPYNTNAGQDLTDWKHFPYTEKKDTLLRVVGIKVFADGGSVGWPALTTLYPVGEAAGTHGNLFKTEDQMDSAVAEILRAGYPIAMHVMGDSAVVVGLNAFSRAFAGHGNALRSRMEHLRIMRADLVDQMAALGVVASIQYTWANPRSSSFEQTFVPEVLEWAYPWRRMADRRVIIAGGNDYPYGKPSHAMQCISYLATRKVQRADVLPDWLDGDQLTVEEGLRGMTVTNAWVVFEEDVKGTVSPGKLADLTVLSADPLSADPFDVRYINVEMTMMDGIIRHNQIGILHTAVHDAGTFRMGVDDRGLWGPVRSFEGLIYKGAEHLRWGLLARFV